ncbi:MAG: nitroreductase family protein, partial [Alistipes sp.]|nr:nitroreductase family protein [Alistipes sp.]
NAAGCGTVLFYEDMAVIEQLKEKYTTYADKFDEYSEHTSAMHQFAVWTALEDMELGASLQHYNPLIDTAVAHQWNISKEWRLIAQMPFGTPLSVTETKAQHLPLTIRRLVFSK